MTCRKPTEEEARRLYRSLRVRAPFSEFRTGLDVEREHADLVGCNLRAFGIIAAAHLRERKDYYTRLLRYVEGGKS